MSGYFSPESIRNRYANKVETNDTPNQLLLETAKNSVSLMRNEGMNNDEIAQILKEKYHFSFNVIQSLIK